MSKVVIRSILVMAVLIVAVAGGAWGLSAFRHGTESAANAANGVPEIGKPAPPFALTDLNGKRVRLSDFKGRPVFLNFWATWCPYCVHEFPAIQAAYQEYGAGNRVVFLAINSGEAAAVVGSFLDKSGFTFPVLLDRDTAVAQRYLVQGLPTSYFISRDGIVRDRVVGALDSASLRVRLSALVR